VTSTSAPGRRSLARAGDRCASADLAGTSHATKHARRSPDGSGWIFAKGWDQTALYHVVAVTALFNYMNRLVEGLGIELDPAYVAPASKRLAERGYLPLIDLMSG
jgi:hypothetical protein